MKHTIYNFIRKSWDSVKQNIDLFVENIKQFEGPITYVSVMGGLVLFLVSLSGRSSLKFSDQEVKFPSVVQQATIDGWRDIGVFYPKMPAKVEEIKVKKKKVSDVQNPAFGLSLSVKQPQLIADDTDALKKNIKDPMQDARQELHRICNNLHRFFYIGTRSIQTDPSRVELLDPLGRHARTTLQIGDLRHTFRSPCVPRTVVIKFGSLPLDLLDERISSSNRIKPLIHSLVQNTTIGLFFDRRLTSRGDDARSEVMFQRVQLEQVHHILMKERLETVYENYQSEEIALMVRNLLHPNAEPVDMPILNDNEILALRSKIRELMLPSHPYGLIPRFTRTENRIVVDMFRILSTNSGILLEFNPLHSIFVIIKQEALYTKYIQKRVEIGCRFTRTDIMTTRMVELKVNLSRVTFDVLRTIISKIPLVKGASSMVNGLTRLADEHCPVEMLLQTGQQYSGITNFNLEQEDLRNQALANFNDELFRINYDPNTRDMSAQVTPFRAFERRDHANHLQEIHSRAFYDVRFTVTVDFDLFAELVKITGPKQN